MKDEQQKITNQDHSSDLDSEQSAIETKGGRGKAHQVILPLSSESQGNSNSDNNDQYGNTVRKSRNKGRTEKNSTTKSRGMRLKVGEELEYRVARFFINQGYFVRRGIPIYTVGFLDQATDLDVLAIKHLDFFRTEVIVCECKSSGDQPLDRVFWVSGVKNYTNADRGILVRKPTRWNIKDFAKEAGVEILDTDRLSTLESVYHIDTNEWPGTSDIEFFRGNYPSWEQVLSGDQYLSELYFTLAGESRYGEPFGAINYIVHHLRVLTRQFATSSSERNTLIRYLITEGVTQLAIFLVNIAKQTFDLTPADRNGLINKRITYGEIDVKLAEKVFQHAFRLSKEVASTYVNQSVEIDQSLFGMPTPDYTELITSFIETLIESSAIAKTFVPITDIFLMETFTKGKSSYKWISRIGRLNGSTASVKLLTRYINLLIKAGCVPAVVSEMAREEGITGSDTNS